MKRDDDRLLPALLLCLQALVWPGGSLLRGTAPSASALLVALLVAATVTAALTVRRSRPVLALLPAVAACALGAGALPTGGTAVLGTAGLALALFTVATERDTFTAVLCAAALSGWQFVHGVSLHGISDRHGLDLVLTALLHAGACGTGLLVRRNRRARAAAELRLEQAESERHRLPAAERRRMERELHDVSAHHLTAVVVTAGAALSLGDRRPELAGEALEFAAGTGRTVTAALTAVRSPAASADELPTPRERLLDLVTGFGRLGGIIEHEIDALPAGAVADAAYGIVREALTNVARHAPGAPTTVVCRYGEAQTEVRITNAAPPAGATAHAAGLGGGRGQGSLRSRAREAGGTLRTGPGPDGGWEVRAELPGHEAALVERTEPVGHRVAQLVAALGLCTQPLLSTLVLSTARTPAEPSGGWQVPAGVLFALLAAAQAVALLWLRRSPRTALLALLALVPLWPVAMALGHWSGPVLLPPLLSAVATCAALVGRERPRPDGTAAGPGGRFGVAGVAEPDGLIAPAGCAAVHAAAAVAAVLGRGTALPLWAVVAGCVAGAVLLVGAAETAGLWRGRRTHDAEDARAARIDDWTEAAVRDAWAERRRITAGLETTVLARTADMAAEAEAGRLEATAERAREALAAMRALLDSVHGDDTPGDARPSGEARPLSAARPLGDAPTARDAPSGGDAHDGDTTPAGDTHAPGETRDGSGATQSSADAHLSGGARGSGGVAAPCREGAADAGAPRRPQPTVDALDLLARQTRATGRDVRIRLTPRVPQRLPAAVDLAAYHLTETLLSATAAQRPAAVTTVELDADEAELTITATGAAGADRPAAAARLAARVDALGGTLTAGFDGSPGAFRISLPLGDGAAGREPGTERDDDRRNR
ncbi:histidine kinase [Streptomyces sp. P38-E01]|uniref:histidine kinase n=1 Tax=Streptomyces tardus TaxID=2780544 RepID=A0A949JFN3_9ACTN|nr:histidine kinase [Streptomyces tardus]MBU7597644.1 histidine kinase [Streptomyces tardus]